MAVGPRQVVEAPQLAPGRGGLIASAVEVPETDERWVNGFVWAPESCDTALVSPIFCSPPGADKAADENEAVREFDPYAVIGWDECSTLDRSRDRVGRARRMLLATESDQMELELWDGAIARQELYPNAFLASPDATDLGSAGAVLALAALEQALAECLHGRRGMIHATPFTASVWNALGLLRAENGLLLTALDTIVVAGSGYTGSAPGVAGDPEDPPPDPIPPADLDAAANAYATGMVFVRRGAIAQVGDETSQIDRSVNTQTVFVERPVAATWDCCHFTIEVDHAASGVASP